MGIALRLEKHGEWDRLIYQGPINEDSEIHLGPTIQQLGPKVIINFRHVEYVNSLGVRAWINYLRELEKGRTLVFEECTPEIVNQINMIPNFKSTASIISVYASYSCDNCDHQRWQLFEKDKNLPQNPDDELPGVTCDKCNHPMEMEELEDEYFSWLEAS